jgi:hypothetical protein
MEMTEAGLTPEQRTKVRKQLLMGNSLISEIKQTKVAAGKSKQRKRILSNMVSGSILKKYKGLQWLSEKTGLNTNKMVGNLKKWFDAEKRTRNRNQEQYKEKVHIFLERDDNSRCQPGKADAKKVDDGVKLQTRVLTDGLSNLHDKFLSENPGLKLLVSFLKSTQPTVDELENGLPVERK